MSVYLINKVSGIMWTVWQKIIWIVDFIRIIKKIHSIYKDLNLNHVDIRLQSQMDTTACIFLFSRQIPRSIARFMPFADMVTGENKSCRKTAQDIVTKKYFCIRSIWKWWEDIIHCLDMMRKYCGMKNNCRIISNRGLTGLLWMFLCNSRTLSGQECIFI